MVSLQDFSHQKLSGHSFRGQDLAGANFRGADIRGADFSHANLTGADFTTARSGQQRYSFGLIWVALLGLMLLSGLISGYAGGLIGHLLFGKDPSSAYDQPIFFVISGVLSLIVLGGFSWLAIRQSLGTAFGGLSFVIAVTIAAAAVVGSAESEALIGTILQLLILAAAIAGAFVGEIVTAAGLILWGPKAIAPTGFVYIAAAIPGALEGADLERVPPSLRGLALLVAGVVAFGILGLSLYIGRAAIVRQDNRYIAIQKISLVIASFGGTRFRHANLTDADFTEATLKSVDFRAARLTRTYWFRARQLHCARLEGTCLESTAIQRLVVTQNGQDQNHDYSNLRGINLQNAQLSGISLIGADLSESSLHHADLSRAKLVKTQLYGANLTGACLTGAFIQDWAIATDTLLNQVDCEYVYMRLPTTDNPDAWRKPDNRNETFKAGDFSDFIAPIVKTLDLYRHQNVDPRQMASTFKTLDFYHYQGIDPGAAAVALKQLAEQYPEAGLEVVALEGRGEEKVRLQAVVADDANQSQLSSEYFERYRQISALPYSDIQALLSGMAEKDKRIRSLEQMVESA
ncbi:MAG: pentapeptide repeat-containing protein, partial [Phormidesmis sp.]